MDFLQRKRPFVLGQVQEAIEAVAGIKRLGRIGCMQGICSKGDQAFLIAGARIFGGQIAGDHLDLFGSKVGGILPGAAANFEHVGAGLLTHLFKKIFALADLPRNLE